MNKKLRCGRLILTNDGIIKKLDLANGGGVRSCDWNRNDTTFNDIHYRLLDVFNLKGRKHETLLYDFQLRPINVKRYATFGEYIDKYALSCNSTVMYLCSREVDGIDKPKIMITNKGRSLSIKPLHSSRFNQQIFTQTKTNSLRTSIEQVAVVSNEPYSNQEEIPSSFLEYSFKNFIKDLIRNVRLLINQNSFDDILLQLFEYICTIHGFISSTIDPLIQKMQQSNEYIQSISSSEMSLHLNSLNNVYDICSSTKRLINRNKNKFGHIQIFSTITNSFSHFYDNLQNLENYCLKNVEKNKNKLNTTSISSSSIRSSIELISSHSHIQLSSKGEDHREIKKENSRKSSHSYQTRSSSIVFKSISSSRELYDEGTSGQISLFQPILNHLRHLLNLLSPKHLSSFRELVESSIDKIKSVRTSIDLNNEQSILDGKRIILFIKEQFINKSVELYYNQSKCDLDRQLNVSCEKILAVIQVLFTSLYYCQMQIDQNNRKDNSNWSSPPPPYIDQRQSENKRSMQSNKRKSQVLHGDDHHS